jgi:polyisoprenoid-binding protein YceI
MLKHPVRPRKLDDSAGRSEVRRRRDRPTRTDRAKLTAVSGPSKHRPWKIAGIVVAVLVVLFVGGPFVYIHFFNGNAPAKLSIKDDSSGGTSTTLSANAAPLAGTWKITSGSQAGYRVQEVLFGQSTTAVGRTTAVTGSMAIAGQQMTSASFVVDMTQVKSDRDQRDAQFQGRIMQTAQFPKATFVASPIKLPAVPSNGATVDIPATGKLTLHGVTNDVSTTLTARRTGNTIEVSGSIPVTFADYKIDNPSASFVTTQDHGSVEFLLKFSPSSGA